MKPTNPERKIILVSAGLLVLLVVGASFLSQPNDDSDMSPTTYNNGSAGTRAAYLLLGELGFNTARWERPTSALGSVDAAHSTLILAQPTVAPDDLDQVRIDIRSFLERGGRVLVTGATGANLLPFGSTSKGTQPFGKLCISTPEGWDPPARAGKVSLSDSVRWNTLTPMVHVQHWCGGDAVAVSYQVGAGTAMWWSSALPLTNSGLKEDASLKLLLTAVTGANESKRQILFDEFLHGIDTSLWKTAKGLPLAQVSWQVAVIALLLIFSYGRHNGPIRLPARLPRSSPIEFAESMGALYRKAGATQAATEAARRRLLRFLNDRCGLPGTITKSDPATIVEALQIHLPGDYAALTQHLAQVAEAEYHALAPRSALALVNALDHDIESLKNRMQKTREQS